MVTKYNPKIANAKKINRNPTIALLKKSDKQQLKYTIFSAPVASTFIPKTGVVKGINVGVKERIYNNYLAAGFGNYMSPYAELYLHKNTRFDTEFGVHAKYNSSEENTRSSLLDSNFLNFNMRAFFKQEERYFDWTATVEANRNNYNWYGLPEENVFSTEVINAIDEAQNYSAIKLQADLEFHDSYIAYANVAGSYFTDKYKSAETLVNFNTLLNFPLEFINPNLNPISVEAGVEFLKGSFKTNYNNSSSIQYNQITAKLIPSYRFTTGNFSLNASLKTFVSLDPENSSTNFFLFPNIYAQTVIYKKYISVYGGLTGNLETNTYQEFTEENPFVSPTLFITQTAETANFFLGFQGTIASNLSYNLKASIIKEEDKPLFLRNNSKSNGTAANINNTPIKGYEYGNSFQVFYDDVNTTSIFAELEYVFDKNLTFATQFQYHNYTTTNAIEIWNLPNIEGSLTAAYKKEKWYANLTTFYLGERKDALYNATYPSSLSNVQTLQAFVDVNLNGGYHFNDKFSAFLNLNNVLDTKYQSFANFNTQGFQILGGITYKFDF